jgi:hypothetical protein
MSERSLSAELVRFIQTSLGSYDAAVLLVCISREPDLGWTRERLAAALGMDSTAQPVSEHVEQFLRAGVLEPEGETSFRLAPGFRDVVEELRVAYDRRPVTLIRVIDSVARAKIQSFADSFKLKRDRD